MTKSKHDLANITISILVDFDKKIAIFDFDFKIVTALSDMSMKCVFKSWNIDSDNTLYLFVSDLNSNI